MRDSSKRYFPVILQKSRAEITFQGIPIHIETPAGGYRAWRDAHNGTSGATRMEQVAYGEIPGAPGLDGDYLDVFVGPEKDAPMVYLVMIKKAPTYQDDDEWKCFLGFRNESDVTATFQLCYSDPRFLGYIRQMPISEFREQVLSGALIKSLQRMPLFIKAFRTDGAAI